jgi:hypothetical protein
MDEATTEAHLDHAKRVSYRERALRALEENRALQARILRRRGGVPIDVDAVLDELRGRKCDAEAS